MFACSLCSLCVRKTGIGPHEMENAQDGADRDRSRQYIETLTGARFFKV